MDTETYAVTEPPLPPTAAGSEPDGGGIGGVTIGAIFAGVLLTAITALGIRRRRAGSLPPDPFGPGEPDVATAESPDQNRALT
jgi:hypothetical protein